MPRYFIYCRKSTESEDRQVLSIESQRRELDKIFIQKERFEIIETFEEAYSAKSPGRPVFDSMIKELKRARPMALLPGTRTGLPETRWTAVRSYTFWMLGN